MARYAELRRGGMEQPARRGRASNSGRVLVALMVYIVLGGYLIWRMPNDVEGVVRANYVCRDKASREPLELAEFVAACGRKFHLSNAELQYVNVEQMILCEEALLSKDGRSPTDFKFDCTYGQIISLLVCTDRDRQVRWDRVVNWSASSLAEYAMRFGISESVLRYAVRCVERLSAPFPYVRVDLYLIGESVFFGELTFTPAGGIDSGLARATDQLIGSQIQLPTDGGESLRSVRLPELASLSVDSSE